MARTPGRRNNVVVSGALVVILAAVLVQYLTCKSLLVSRIGFCRLIFPKLPASSSPSVLWMAPFFSSSGYGSEALSYVQALQGRLSLKVIQHGDSEDYRYWTGLPQETKQLLLKMSQENVVLNKTIVICHSEPGAWHPPLYQTVPCPPTGYEQPAYVIGRTMFETDRLTEEHVKRCNLMDEVWVPSEFNMKSFAASGVHKLKLVKMPQAVDVDFFNPKRHTPLKLSGQRVFGPHSTELELISGAYVFLSIFKWEKRKGWDILLKAFLEEFSEQDNVVLYMVTSAYHTGDDFTSRISELVQEQGLAEPSTGWPSVYVQKTHVPQVDLPRLYKAANAFVLPSRGEGWGRPHVEAMSMGLPVIATNWSGPTEFMTDGNSYPVAISGLTEIEDGAFRGHMWAEPSVEKLKYLMRHVFHHREEAEARGAQARKDMVVKFSPEIISQLILRELWRIQAVKNATR